MENNNPLQDDFSLGDVMKDSKEGISQRTKYIVIGLISFVLLITIIVVIASIATKKTDSEKEPNSMSKNSIINCTFEVGTTQNEISILNDKYEKK